MVQPRIIMVYDDACAFCRTQVQRLRRLDWMERFEWTGSSVFQPARADWAARRRDLHLSIHGFLPDGRVLTGAACLRHMGMRLPLLAPLALLLWIPGALKIAERLYAWVAHRRYCLHKHCASSPEPKHRTPA